MKHAILFLVAAALVLGGTQASAGADKTATLKLAVAGMACEGCESHIKKGVGGLDGVVSVKANSKKARVTVLYEPGKVTKSKIRQKITALGYVIGDKDPPVVYPKGADVKTISKKGESVKVEQHLASGKVTIVDFYADWCKPCKALDRRLAMKIKKAPKDLAVRKVNIVDWETPVSKKYLKNVSGLPYVRVYDRRGRLTVSLAGDDVEKLDTHLEKLGVKL